MPGRIKGIISKTNRFFHPFRMMNAQLVRLLCPYCGNAVDVSESKHCPKCGKQIDIEYPAAITIMRIHDPKRIRIKRRTIIFKVSINQMQLGCLKHYQKLVFPLSYGVYHVRVTGWKRNRYAESIVELTPENPHVYLRLYEKRRFIRRNKIILERVDPSLCANWNDRL